MVKNYQCSHQNNFFLIHPLKICATQLFYGMRKDRLNGYSESGEGVGRSLLNLESNRDRMRQSIPMDMFGFQYWFVWSLTSFLLWYCFGPGNDLKLTLKSEIVLYSHCPKLSKELVCLDTLAYYWNNGSAVQLLY